MTGTSLFSIPADGSGSREQLAQSDRTLRPNSWSADGRTLLYSEDAPAIQSDLWTLSTAPDAKRAPYLQTPADESNAAFSPDGRWVAYQSDESGRSEVYVRAFPDSGGKWQISNGGGTMPHWAANGREIVYHDNEDGIAAAEVRSTPGGSFQFEPPRQLFRASVTRQGLEWVYDIAPDGKSFVVTQSVAVPVGAMHVTLIFNWCRRCAIA
jgi:dipeptidyl aminopeptidase/acylaminoacyl peptidase